MRVDPLRLMRLGELIRQGSFKRAADLLHITPSALSQSIAQMEGEVGVRLIDRTPHGVVPTIYGEALLGHANTIEGQLSEAARKIAELTFGQSNVLAIGGTSGGAIGMLARAVCRMRAVTPEIETRIVEETWGWSLLEQVDNRSLDVAVCHRPNNDELTGKLALPLFQARRYVCVRAGHPERDNLTLETLAAYPFACPAGGWGIEATFEQLFEDLGIDFSTRQVLPSNSLSVAKTTVLNSDAFAIFSDVSILDEQQQGLFHRTPMTGMATEYWYHLVTREDYVATSLFVGFVQALSNVCEALGISVHRDIAKLRAGQPLRR